MTPQRKPVMLTTLAALLAAGTLAACDRAEEKTVGQKMDNAIAKVEKKVDEAKVEAGNAATDAKQAIGNAADAVANKAEDAAITAAINAELAKDANLSALRINVDTVDGRVALRGTAPDAAARDRATTLAKAVSGVKSVDNLLEIQKS
jgi:osmotically-inducible protein OsmY